MSTNTNRNNARRGKSGVVLPRRQNIKPTGEIIEDGNMVYNENGDIVDEQFLSDDVVVYGADTNQMVNDDFVAINDVPEGETEYAYMITDEHGETRVVGYNELRDILGQEEAAKYHDLAIKDELPLSTEQRGLVVDDNDIPQDILEMNETSSANVPKAIPKISPTKRDPANRMDDPGAGPSRPSLLINNSDLPIDHQEAFLKVSEVLPREMRQKFNSYFQNLNKKKIRNVMQKMQTKKPIRPADATFSRRPSNFVMDKNRGRIVKTQNSRKEEIMTTKRFLNQGGIFRAPADKNLRAKVGTFTSNLLKCPCCLALLDPKLHTKHIEFIKRTGTCARLMPKRIRCPECEVFLPTVERLCCHMSREHAAPTLVRSSRFLTERDFEEFIVSISNTGYDTKGLCIKPKQRIKSKMGEVQFLRCNFMERPSKEHFPEMIEEPIVDAEMKTSDACTAFVLKTYHFGHVQLRYCSQHLHFDGNVAVRVPLVVKKRLYELSLKRLPVSVIRYIIQAEAKNYSANGSHTDSKIKSLTDNDIVEILSTVHSVMKQYESVEKIKPKGQFSPTSSVPVPVMTGKKSNSTKGRHPKLEENLIIDVDKDIKPDFKSNGLEMETIEVSAIENGIATTERNNFESLLDVDLSYMYDPTNGNDVIFETLSFFELDALMSYEKTSGIYLTDEQKELRMKHLMMLCLDDIDDALCELAADSHKFSSNRFTTQELRNMEGLSQNIAEIAFSIQGEIHSQTDPSIDPEKFADDMLNQISSDVKKKRVSYRFGTRRRGPRKYPFCVTTRSDQPDRSDNKSYVMGNIDMSPMAHSPQSNMIHSQVGSMNTVIKTDLDDEKWSQMGQFQIEELRERIGTGMAEDQKMFDESHRATPTRGRGRGRGRPRGRGRGSRQNTQYSDLSPPPARKRSRYRRFQDPESTGYVISSQLRNDMGQLPSVVKLEENVGQPSVMEVEHEVVVTTENGNGLSHNHSDNKANVTDNNSTRNANTEINV